MEEWKDIKGFEGKYQVSNLGNVRSLWRGKPSGRGKYVTKEISIKELKKIKSNELGYQIVTLMDNGKRKRKQVHRLVAETFIPNPDNKPNVNHIDYNPSNNNVDNLEWCTQRENVLHSVCHFHKRNYRKTNSGHSHIYKTNCNTYLVRLGKPRKSFKTLEEAIIYRDKLIKEME